MKRPFSVIVPVYNEEKSVASVLKYLDEVLKKSKHKYEIIAVNDCSKDKSLQVLKGLKIKNLKVLNHHVNQGYGTALKTGIRAAAYDTLVITDSDGTYPVDAIPRLVAEMDHYDMVVGARVGKGAKIPLIRKPVKTCLNLFASYLAGAYVPDLNSGLRVFTKEIVDKFWNLFPKRFSFTSTLTMCCLTNGYRVKFAPIRYYRRSGSSSIHPIKDTIRFFNLLTKLSLFFNPWRIFMPLFLLFFALGIIRGLRDYLLQDSFGGLTLVLLFLAFQIFFFGLLASIITKR